MSKLIGYARVSTQTQETDRQIADLLAAGVRRDDFYTDHGVSGARAARPAFGAALDALHEGDTLVVTTLDQLGKSTANMLELAVLLPERKAVMRVLSLGGRDADTGTPIGSMVFTVLAALAQMELEINNAPTHRRRPAGHPGRP